MTDCNLREHELSGAKLIVPFTKLSHLGPKHLAVIIGINEHDGELWIAELSRRFGYRLVSLPQWLADNQQYATSVDVEPNRGNRSNWQVAESAIKEVLDAQKDKRSYHVINNNCENFVLRHQTGSIKTSTQVKSATKWLALGSFAGLALFRQLVKRKRRT